MASFLRRARNPQFLTRFAQPIHSCDRAGLTSLRKALLHRGCNYGLSCGLLLAFLAGCDTGSSGLITRFGEYPSPNKNYILKVERRETSLVAGSVLAADGKILVSETIGSDAMRWCFYWTPQGELWAYSSDTGLFKAINFRDTQSQARKVTPNERIPEPLYDFLPGSLKSVYAK